MSCACRFIADPSKPSRTSHCAGCHETFSSVTAFDLHQRLDNGKLVCLNPRYARRKTGARIFEVLRLTPDRKPVWGQPGNSYSAELHSRRWNAELAVA